MEWYREGSVVRAGLALNAFRLLRQYDLLSKDRAPDEQYEATLALCVLQSLLTNCWEFHKSLNDRQRKEQFESVFTTVDSLLQDPDVSVENRFPGEFTPSDVLEHLRNALSHPALRDTSPPTTGYTTVLDPSGLVTRLRFIDSPDLNSKGNLTQEALRYFGSEPHRARVFVMELPFDRLRTLAEDLALFLAQPVLEKWTSDELRRLQT